MAWRAKTVISSPQGTAATGDVCRSFNPAFLRKCIEQGLCYDDLSDEQDEPELNVGDMLDSLNRGALMVVISLNHLPITVMKKWTDGQIRQAIRDIHPEVTTLLTQPARSGEVDLSLSTAGMSTVP